MIRAGGRQRFFLKKKNQETFDPPGWASPAAPKPKRQKGLCCFFSKKQFLLPLAFASARVDGQLQFLAAFFQKSSPAFPSLRLALLVLTLGASAAPSPDLQRILAGYDAYLNDADPITAGQRGDLAAAARWPDDAPAAVARRHAVLIDLQTRLRAIPAASLAGEDALNRTLLAARIDLDLEGQSFDEERIPFTSDEGFFVTPTYAAEGTSPHTAEEAKAWLARLRALPAYYATETANMRRGLDTGFTQPRQTALAALHTVQAMAATPPERSALMAPLSRLPSSMPAAEQQRLKSKALGIIRSEDQPAERALADFLAQTYVPKARTSIGIFSVPNGRDYYAYRVRRETTTNLTPDQIYALGTSEIARIRKAMQVQIEAAGFRGSFADFQSFLRHDPQFYAPTAEALLEKASRLAKMVDDRLPGFFGKLPRLSYGVRPVPAVIAEGYTSARYDPGSPEQGIAGGLMINTSHLDQRPLYELPALVSHEGAPGHHIQIALAQELQAVPDFRRDSDITAFVEGWALYAEQLGLDMGIYRTPDEKFGLLSMEMWRACRLVVDVGIHWKNYTRDQAVACLRDNTALADKNIQNEVDRYIAWPGQALGYKIGELTILDLRHQAEAALGAKFDIRAFHDAVLDEGAMPLDVLKQRIAAWLDARRRLPR